MDDENGGGSGLEMDRISFSSWASSPADLYMSVRESPCNGEASDSDCLSLSSRHRENDSLVDHFTDALSERLDSLIRRSEEAGKSDDEFFCSLPNLSALRPLPSVVREPPAWSDLQSILRSKRKADASVSIDVEETNVSIYAAGLALSAIEEARWLNDVSKDPLLSRLVNEIDPDFPLAVRSQRVSQERDRLECTDNLLALKRSIEHSPQYGSCPVLSCSSSDGNQCGSEECRVRCSRDGVDETVIRTRTEPRWDVVAAHSLVRAFTLNPIRDIRVARWVNDMAAHFDKLLSLESPASCRGFGDVPVSSSEMLVEGTVVKLRGTTEWAPPRDAWIFTPVKMESPKVQLEEQKGRCAGCGLRLENGYAKRVRFCEYFGKLFCQCCHQGSKSIIPAKIIATWNFNEFPVSDRALRFLSQAKDQPAIHIATVAPGLVSKINLLKRVIVMREKLGHMWQFVRTCRVAEETVTNYGNLKTMFTSLERHLLQSSDTFSLSDLQRVHNKDLVSLLEPIVYYGKCHIEGCQDCQAQAFVCSLCSDATDLLFPFQSEKVVRCAGCGSLAHIKCDARNRRNRASKGCPKCARIQLQRIRQRIVSCGDV